METERSTGEAFRLPRKLSRRPTAVRGFNELWPTRTDSSQPALDDPTLSADDLSNYCRYSLSSTQTLVEEMSCIPAPEQEGLHGASSHSNGTHRPVLDVSAVAGAATSSGASTSGQDLSSAELLGRAAEAAYAEKSTGFLRQLVFGRLQKLEHGAVVVKEGKHSWLFGDAECTTPAILMVRSPKFYRRIVTGGGLGAAESYIQGEWDSTDLCELLQVLGRNSSVLSSVNGTLANLLKPIRLAANWFQRNTKAGSRRNISAHYDLSNDFFALMLDPSMTYSSAVFARPEMTLAEAQHEKYDRICRKLDLKPADHVLEIGTGWGGMAIHAAKNYGCRVTTTTISAQQHQLAKARIHEAGLEDRITLLQQDYRDLTGSYDKLISIEMIEAVGEQYLPGYFAQCSKLLKPDGAMALQAITIPDHRFDAYRRSVDFIQRYIFPGGFLPSIGAIGKSLAKSTDFRFFHSEDFGPHYAETLLQWRENFWQAIDRVRQLGFDRRFIRTWEYYLCYCEAGFRERLIGVSQLVLTKPLARMEPIL